MQTTTRTRCDCGKSLEGHYLTLFNARGGSYSVWSQRMLKASAFVARCSAPYGVKRSEAFTLAEVLELVADLLVPVQITTAATPAAVAA